MTNFAAKYPPVTAAGGGGGTGTVTQVNTGAGLTGGPISTIGTVSLLAVATNRALVSDGSGILAAATTTATEIGYVNGVTSSIQTQLNGKQATLTIGDLTDAGTDGIVVTGGTGAVIGSGTSVAQHVADTTHNGYLSSTDWNTFNGKEPAVTKGNLTDAGTDGIVVTGGTGAVIGSGTSLAQHVADATHNGYLASGDWSTFNGKQAALTIGNLTDAGTDGITVTGGTGAVIGTGTSIAQHVADTTHSGYLSSTDWNTFNGKGAGTVTAVSVASANGFTGSSSGGATPALTVATSITGILQGNGTAISAVTSTGSGNNVLATSPTLVTPILGTPTSGTLTNCTTLGGITTGSAVASGIIGEKISSSAITDNTALTTSFADVCTITVSAGVWMLTFQLTLSAAPGTTTNNDTSAVAQISDNSNVLIGTSQRNLQGPKTPVTSEAQTIVSVLVATEIVSVSGSTTYKLQAKKVDNSGTGSGAWFQGTTNGQSTFFALRVG